MRNLGPFWASTDLTSWKAFSYSAFCVAGCRFLEPGKWPEKTASSRRLFFLLYIFFFLGVIIGRVYLELGGMGMGKGVG